MKKNPEEGVQGSKCSTNRHLKVGRCSSEHWRCFEVMIYAMEQKKTLGNMKYNFPGWSLMNLMEVEKVKVQFSDWFIMKIWNTCNRRKYSRKLRGLEYSNIASGRMNALENQHWIKSFNEKKNLKNRWCEIIIDII